MKFRIITFIQIVLLLMMVCVTAAAADSLPGTSLSLSKTTAAVGDSITASGTTRAEAWVPLKIIDEAGNILVFDAKKADINGNYSLKFILPASASGTLTVIVGEGSNVAAATKIEVLTLTDITGHWAEDNIKKLVALGAITGYPDGTFKPNNNITRAEFAAIFVRAFKLETHSDKVFTDTTGHWAKDVIATAAYHGIINGYDKNTFGPNDLITREQMAAMMVRAKGLAPVTEEAAFADSGKISAWAKGSIAAAAKSGIIKGYGDNTVRPLNNATRAEAVTVIVNAMQNEGV